MSEPLRDSGPLVEAEADAEQQLEEYKEDTAALLRTLAPLFGSEPGTGRPLQRVTRQVEALHQRYTALLEDNQNLLRLAQPSTEAYEGSVIDKADALDVQQLRFAVAEANLQQELLRQEIEVLRREGSSPAAEAEIARLRWQLQELEAEAQDELNGMHEEMLEMRHVCEQLDASLRQSEAKREKLTLDQQQLQSTLMETAGELALLQRSASGSTAGPNILPLEIEASSDEGPRTPSPHSRAAHRPWDKARGKSESEESDASLHAADRLAHLQKVGSSARPLITSDDDSESILEDDPSVGQSSPGRGAAQELMSKLERLRCSNEAVTQELVATKMELAELHEAHLSLRRAAFVLHASPKDTAATAGVGSWTVPGWRSSMGWRRKLSDVQHQA